MRDVDASDCDFCFAPCPRGIQDSLIACTACTMLITSGDADGLANRELATLQERHPAFRYAPDRELDTLRTVIKARHLEILSTCREQQAGRPGTVIPN